MNTVQKPLSLQHVGGLILFAVLFIGAALASQAFEAELSALIESYGLLSQLAYFTIALVATVFAPLNMTFLIPVASTAYGPLMAALLSIGGWTTGSLIAFYIARKFGRPVVARFVDLKKVDRLQRIVPDRNIFIWVILLRMAVPADILSYVLGLFVPMRYTHYTLATLIGVIPFAFIFAYASTMALPFMLIALALALLSSSIGIWWVRQQLRKQPDQGERS